MEEILSNFQKSSEKVITILKEDFKSIRTGKSNPSLVENLVVETYGGQTKLKLLELAAIMNEGTSALSIIPYDRSTIKDIEKTILKSPLGLSPAIQGSKIIVRIPALSEEQREKFVKIVNQKTEEKKNQIRALRDEVRKKTKARFESKEISEDVKFKIEKELDIETKKIMTEIHYIKEKKETEIRKI